MSHFSAHVVCCNGASHELHKAGNRSILHLNYEEINGVNPNVRIGLPKFVGSVYHLPERVLDLLEIASYIYCADRSTKRGEKSDVEYHGWARSFTYAVKVRDADFWQKPETIHALNDLLTFLSGDSSHELAAIGGHATDPTSLFDQEEFRVERDHETDIALFSGGLDSLSGTIHQLSTSSRRVCLVSHQSLQPSISRTQNSLVRSLRDRYENRIQHYPYQCSLIGKRAVEETQRTRFFLYAAIAYAVACAYGKGEFYVYENGITSLNFPKRQDLQHGRASRTTHPKTIALLAKFLSLVHGQAFEVQTPFFWQTKTDILRTLETSGGADLISSSVSCSKTFKATLGRTQCGTCSQCVDRRFALSASRLTDYEIDANYAVDFITEKIEGDEARSTIIEFLFQAQQFYNSNIDSFYQDRLDELIDIVGYIPNMEEDEAVERIYSLCQKHGVQIVQGLKQIQHLYDDPSKRVVRGSLLDIIHQRDYLKDVKQNPKPTMKDKIELFYSYSHSDEALRNELEKHLSILKRNGVINNWYDRRIIAGSEFDGEINEHLQSADIILLLVSPDFLASDYCWEIETARALERHEAGETHVIPVILRDCDWHSAPFGKLLAAPRDGKAITGRHWHSPDEGFTDVARAIRTVIEETRSNSH